MGRRPGPGVNEANVPPNPPALQGGEEARAAAELRKGGRNINP